MLARLGRLLARRRPRPISRTNLFTFPAEFDNAAWTKAAATITANAVAAPDGSATADTLVESNTSAVHAVTQSRAFTAAQAYTASVYVKAAGRSLVFVLFPTATFGANVGVEFNAATGVVSAVSGGATGSVISLGGGWYRIIASATATASASAAIELRLRAVSGASVYLGDGTSGMNLWGAKLEAAAGASAYP